MYIHILEEREIGIHSSTYVQYMYSVNIEFEIGTRKLTPNAWGKTAAPHIRVDHIIKMEISFTKYN